MCNNMTYETYGQDVDMLVGGYAIVLFYVLVMLGR